MVALLITSKSRDVLNVAIPLNACATSIGRLKPRGGRPLVPAVCVILRSCGLSSAMDSVKDLGRLPSKPALEPSPLLELARPQHQPNKLACVGYKKGYSIQWDPKIHLYNLFTAFTIVEYIACHNKISRISFTWRNRLCCKFTNKFCILH